MPITSTTITLTAASAEPVDRKTRVPHPDRRRIMLPKLCLIFLLCILAAAQTRADLPEPTPCPSLCKCFWLPDQTEGRKAWVDCVGIAGGLYPNSYDDVISGPELPAEVVSLDLTYNNVSMVYATDITPSLKLLRIQSNVIQSLENESFVNFPNLETVELMYNNISQIAPATFRVLKNLKVLNLQTNAISHLPDGVFDQNLVLEELHMSHNPLKVIYREWFSSLQKLKVLHLSQTQLYAIRPETLHPLRSLQTLDLSGNLFTSVPTDGLRSVPSLRRLVLNGNPIRTLDQSSFEQMSHVQQLELCHMERLVEIRERTFRDMTGLRNLSISDNHDLSHMHESAFYGMFNSTHFSLRTLSLRKNGLHFLLSHSLPFHRLDRLEIQQNPWHCNCDFLWVAHCPSVVGDPRCSQPAKYRGIEVHHIQKDAFTACANSVVTSGAPTPSPASDSGMLKSLMLMMAATLLLVLGISLALVVKRNDVLNRDSRKGSGSIYYVKAHSGHNSLTDVPVGSLI